MLFQNVASIDWKIETLVNRHIIVDLAKRMTIKVWSIVCFLKKPKLEQIWVKEDFIWKSHNLLDMWSEINNRTLNKP